MKRSTDRILTTHAGSLPRPDDIVEMMGAREANGTYDKARLEERVITATDEVVRRQRETGLDVVSDGEIGKPSFSTYVNERITGFEPRPIDPSNPPRPIFVDMLDFPEFAKTSPYGSIRFGTVSTCVAPIEYVGEAAVRAELERFKKALDSQGAAEAFVPAAAPGMVSRGKRNEYYKTDEEYLFAIADAMNHEYRAITNAGFVLQLDAPDLPLDFFPEGYPENRRQMSVAESQTLLELRIEALNRSLKGIEPGSVRLHICWGNYLGPHHLDTPLSDIIQIVLKARVGAIYVEASNPRHTHEWRVFGQVKLPPETVVIPGVIDSVSNFIEHAEAVADRIEQYAQLVGRENVIAGTDCGFGTQAWARNVHPEIVWPKLGALVEGARIATRRLWG